MHTNMDFSREFLISLDVDSCMERESKPVTMTIMKNRPAGTKLVLIEDVGYSIMSLKKYEGRDMVGEMAIYADMQREDFSMKDRIEDYRVA